MEFTQIKNILASHGVQVKNENDKLFALQEWWERDGANSSNWVDVTDFSLAEIGNLLGY